MLWHCMPNFRSHSRVRPFSFALVRGTHNADQGHDEKDAEKTGTVESRRAQRCWPVGNLWEAEAFGGA